jgi:hypothetical protein
VLISLEGASMNQRVIGSTNEGQLPPGMVAEENTILTVAVHRWPLGALTRPTGQRPQVPYAKSPRQDSCTTL